MIGSKIFRKHFLILGAVTVSFIFVGLGMNLLMKRIIEVNHAPPNPPSFLAKIIDEIDSKNRVSALVRLEEIGYGEMPFSLSIISEKGEVLYPKNDSLEIDWTKIKKPELPYQFEKTNLRNDELPGMMPPLDGIIRFKNPPEQYLLIRFKGPKDMTGMPPPARFLFTSIALLIVSVLIGIGIALALLYKTLGSKISLADSVISELKKGNLKARFPIKKKDEFGQAIDRFNQMADEIEHLVEALRKSEQSRMILLQELAHDLRTPIASLKNILETVHEKEDQIALQDRKDLSNLAIKEVTYFENLVEDLLVLAQISEPKYQEKKKYFNFKEVIDEAIEGTEYMEGVQSQNVSFSTEMPKEDISFLGNKLLIARMLRNVLSNAASFAKNKVTVKAGIKDKELVILITDDGPGFSKEALESFGTRRTTRTLGTAASGARLSVGLGAVIMKSIAEAHGGRLLAQNRLNGNSIVGAEISITLPL